MANDVSELVSPEVLAALPRSHRVVSAVSDGTSSWSQTVRLTTEDEAGKRKQFFLKRTWGAHGKEQLQGEFEGMREMRSVMPAMVPEVYAWGEERTQKGSSYFLLSDYLKMSKRLPDPVALAEQMSAFHRKSKGRADRFGFHVATYDGMYPQNTGWDSSWATYFTTLVRSILETDFKINGHWKELDDVARRTFERVIPRLLNGLTDNGEPIKPCLIHGDLWEGNIGTDFETNQIYIFDAACYYGHHEMDVAIWRTAHHQMREKAYTQEYMKRMRPSEPVDEWEDRSRLYGVKTKLMFSVHNPSTPQVRKGAYGDLLYLANKYAPLLDTSTNTLSVPVLSANTMSSVYMSAVSTSTEREEVVQTREFPTSLFSLFGTLVASVRRLLGDDNRLGHRE